MKNEIVKSESRSIVLTDRDEAICRVLNKFNQLRSFRLDPIEILEWKDSLNRLIGEKLDTKALDFAIDKMMTGEIEYDKNKGIQNIFDALKQVAKKENGEYKIKTFVW